MGEQEQHFSWNILETLQVCLFGNVKIITSSWAALLLNVDIKMGRDDKNKQTNKKQSEQNKRKPFQANSCTYTMHKWHKGENSVVSYFVFPLERKAGTNI